MHYGNISLVAFAGGAVLFLLSHIVGYMTSSTAGGNAAWTEEEATQYHDSAARLHALSHQHAHAGHSHESTEITPAGNSNELSAAKAKFEEQTQQLQSARNRGQGFTLALRWLGILSALGGGIGYFVWRNIGERAA